MDADGLLSSQVRDGLPITHPRVANRTRVRETRSWFDFGLARARVYLTLTKPRITGLVVATAAAGFLVAAPLAEPILLLHTLLGIALVAGGTNGSNQVMERHIDARMRRTRRRPMPQGLLGVTEAVFFCGILAGAGIAYLAVAVNLLTAALAMATVVSYTFVYTPLKRVHSLSTVVGAIPGALPILGGWTAATGSIGPGGVSLFALLFVWQLPHFLALAWVLRDDYARAGLRMLVVGDSEGWRTRQQAFLYTLVLLPVSLLPSLIGLAGIVYFVAAVLLGGGFLWMSIEFGRGATSVRARGLFRYSVAYLPLLLLVLTLDKLP